MTDDVLEPLARLTTTAEAIEGLRDLFGADETLDLIAGQVATMAVTAVANADAVSITVLSWPQARTAASTDERALDLDSRQYASGRGPCLEAALSRKPVRAVMSESLYRWPEFVVGAQRAGVRSSLSVPLVVGRHDDEPEMAGSLNVYSDTASAFDSFDEELMRLYTVAAGHAITSADRLRTTRAAVAQLERGLASRSSIEMAKGALIAAHGCSPQEAFDKLVKESQRRNVKLRDVAAEMLALLESS